MAISPAEAFLKGTLGKSRLIKVLTRRKNSKFISLMTFSADNFDRLADLISSYPAIARSTHFVFVPGPLDITANSILPRRPLLSSFVQKLKTKLAKAHFMSNPCRLKIFGQEIVIFREDMMARMLRHLVGAKIDVQNDDLKRYVRQLRELTLYAM